MSQISEVNNSQMKRGFLDMFVLLVLYQKNLYPSEIIEMLESVGIDMPEGTLYPLLNRLKNDQKVTYKWEESTSGPPRKYFQITTKGKEFAQSRLESVKDLFNSIKSICKLNSVDF